MRPSLALAPQPVPLQASRTMSLQASRTIPLQAPLQTMLHVQFPKKKTRAPCKQRKLRRKLPRLSLSNLTLPPCTVP
jgi:hypothetical protein